MKHLFVVNPVAGKQKPEEKLRLINEAIDRLPAEQRSRDEFEIYVTEAPMDACRHIRGTAADGAELRVYACGGDGTLNEVVAGLLASGCPKPLGYIPAGTTNDFAASLRLPRNMAKATEAILKGAPHQLDAGIFNDRYFVYIASFGAFTEASYAAPQNAKNAFGHLAYVLEGLKDLTAIRPFPMTVEADGRRYEGPFLFGSVSNTTSIGGMVKLPPALVEMGDGRLEVLLIRPPQNASELTRILQCLQKQAYDGELVNLFQTASLDVQCPEPFSWSLDGERAEGGKQLHIRCLPHAVTLIK